MLAALRQEFFKRVSAKQNGQYVCYADCKSIRPFIGLRHLILDAVSIEGDGLLRFRAKQLNAIFIQGDSGLDASHVVVTFSAADAVSIKNTVSGFVEVLYRANNGILDITITIFIAGSIHSVHTATCLLSSAASVAFYERDPPMTDVWFNVLQDHALNRDVIIAACKQIDRTDAELGSRTVMAVMTAARVHFLQEQSLYAKVLGSILNSNFFVETEYVHELSTFIYTLIHSYPYSMSVQSYASGVILKIAKLSAEHKRILLEGRAIEVFLHASSVVPYIFARPTLEYLQE